MATVTTTTNRFQRAEEIAETSTIFFVDGLWFVESQTKKKTYYHIKQNEKGDLEECDCQDFKNRKLICKHIIGLVFFIAYQKMGVKK